MDDNQLNEVDMVVDDENLLIETEIQDVDNLNVDTDAKENLVIAPAAMERQSSVVACQIQEFKTEEGCEMVKVRDKRAAAYRTLNTEKVKREVPVEKPKQNNINNPQGAINKGGRRGERRKSGRELALKAKTKQSKKCGHCGEKTNKHTKTTCPSNLKYISKLARIAAEQAAKDAAKDAAKNDAAAEQPTRTDVVEEPTNAS
ncbi:hypothetical protein Tco_1041961 [Tanacetum coccineum]|uniref:Protein FAR1-RELATED SEQUENCE n=1 Tax=Tanacetum coccineum TaxID=301880 RepID=A0ABQ5GJ70_9ASTR